MNTRNIQNGLVSLGVFIAISQNVIWWQVFLWAALLWNYNEENK